MAVTKFFHCDGPDCDEQMREDDPKLSLTVPEPDLDDDPLELRVDLDLHFDGDRHFCSDACLSAWAFGRGIST